MTSRSVWQVRCQHGGGGCHCGQVGHVLEDTGRPAKLPLDVFIHLARGIGLEGVGARPEDIFQPQQERPECVSATNVFASRLDGRMIRVRVTSSPR